MSTDYLEIELTFLSAKVNECTAVFYSKALARKGKKRSKVMTRERHRTERHSLCIHMHHIGKVDVQKK
jgi:hypothetical protein